MLSTLVIAIAAAAAATQNANLRYQDCVSLVEADIELGRAAAQEWTAAGGGADAQHCLAIADIAAGFPKLGAARLEAVAQRKDAGDDFIRARLLAQAAEAWIEAGELKFAEAAIKDAFNLVPEAGELHLTAAKVYGAQERWQQAIDSVTAAEEAGFTSADAYVIRGRAHAALGDYQTAAQNVVRALTLEPTNLDALVLRGEIQQAGIVIDVYLGDAENAPESDR